MLGGYNVGPLVEALKSKDKEIAEKAVNELSHTILVYDAFNDVKDLMDSGNEYAKKVVESWG